MKNKISTPSVKPVPVTAENFDYSVYSGWALEMALDIQNWVIPRPN